MSNNRVAPQPTSLWLFFRHESLGHLKTTWRASWRSWLVATLLAWLWLMVSVFSRSGWLGVEDALGTALVGLAFAAFVGFFVGFALGLVALGWRLFGWAFLFACVLGPLVLVLAFWLSADWLLARVDAIGATLLEAAQRRGLPASTAAADSLGGMGGSGGGGAAVLLLVLLLIYFLPPLLMDLAEIGFDPAVLLQILWFFLAFAVVVVSALLVTVVVTAPPLLLALVLRTRRRWREFKASTLAAER